MLDFSWFNTRPFHINSLGKTVWISVFLESVTLRFVKERCPEEHLPISIQSCHLLIEIYSQLIGIFFSQDHINKQTTWIDPRSGMPSSPPNQRNTSNWRHEDELGPLPECWEQRVHTDGRIFFIDHSKNHLEVVVIFKVIFKFFVQCGYRN